MRIINTNTATRADGYQKQKMEKKNQVEEEG